MMSAPMFFFLANQGDKETFAARAAVCCDIAIQNVRTKIHRCFLDYRSACLGAESILQ